MINCLRLAFVALSAKLRVAISHNMQLSIFAKNLCWIVQRLAALAFALVLVNNLNSLTNLIFNPSGKTVVTEEYSHSSQFWDVAGSDLSTLICKAFTLVLLLASHLMMPSSMAL